MNNFEAESRSILLNYRASLNNNFDTNEESLEKALTALTQLHQQEVLKLIGEDEDRDAPINRNWKPEIDARNMFRTEMRTNLNKEANND